jgi:hypothetical protein
MDTLGIIGILAFILFCTAVIFFSELDEKEELNDNYHRY